MLRIDWVSLSAKAFLDAVNFVDQLRSEFNRLGEAARYAVASRLQLVVVVRPLANFPIFYLHDRYSRHANWNLPKRPPRKGSVCVAVRVHSLMMSSPMLKEGLSLLSESGKRSRIFAKNLVKRPLSSNSSPSAWSINVNWSLK